MEEKITEAEHLREMLRQYQEADKKNINELKTHLLNAIHVLNETTVAVHNQLFNLECRTEINNKSQN